MKISNRGISNFKKSEHLFRQTLTSNRVGSVEKTTQKLKTLIGRAELTNQTLAVRCGGVVARLLKKHWDVSFKNMSARN